VEKDGSEMFFNSLLPSDEFFYYCGRKRRHRRKLIGGGGGFCDWIWMRMLMLDEEGMEGRGKRERGRWNMTAWWEMTES
jgi:hypothetical protein